MKTFRFSFQLPTSGGVKLSVYDLIGQRVAVLVNGFKPAGTHQVIFDGFGKASGMYFCQLSIGDYRLVRKAILLK